MTDNMTDITGRQVRSDHIPVVMNSDYANNHVRYHAGSRHNEWSGIFNRATHHITEGDCITQRARVPHHVPPPHPPGGVQREGHHITKGSCITQGPGYLTVYPPPSENKKKRKKKKKKKNGWITQGPGYLNHHPGTTGVVHGEVSWPT